MRGDRLGSLVLLGAIVACAPEGSSDPSTSGPECGPVQLAKAPECPALVAAARRDGSVPVVVTLTTDFTPEGRLGELERRRQRRQIAQAQDALLDGLAPHRPRVLARYTATPQLALTVNPAALRALLTSRLVAHVQHDTPQPPG